MLVLVALVGCNGDKPLLADDTGAVAPSPGAFSFTYLGNLGGPPAPPSCATANFDLGEIRASRDFYFLLRNTGDDPITDITLSSSSEDTFAVSPGSIESLEAGDDVEFLPIIRVSAIHGVALDGYGTTDVMSMGTNTTTLNIEGAISDAESASLEVTLSVDALLMDIELYCDGVAVDLSENDGSSSSSLGGVGWLPRYPCADGEVKLENTGNVDIEVSYYRGSTLYDAESLGQGSTITVADTTEDNQHWILELAGDNTIVDADRLTMGDNGRAYLIVETTNDQD